MIHLTMLKLPGLDGTMPELAEVRYQYLCWKGLQGMQYDYFYRWVLALSTPTSYCQHHHDPMRVESLSIFSPLTRLATAIYSSIPSSQEENKSTRSEGACHERICSTPPFYNHPGTNNPAPSFLVQSASHKYRRPATT